MIAFLRVEKLGADSAWLVGEGFKDGIELPRGEQTRVIGPGDEILVAIDEDDEGSFASMRLDDYMMDAGAEFREGQPVDLWIWNQTPLGFKAVVDGTHWGVLYSGEIFTPLKYGQHVKGFIKKVREDRKLDLTLQDPSKVGHKAAADVGPRILEELKKNGGFLPITDKTAPEEIYERFGVSKKKFKIALGGLYKRRLIVVEDAGIRLAK